MTSTTSNSFSTDTLFYSVSTHQTGATTSTVPSISVQPTSEPGLGTFTGLKTFKPSSPFEASSLESLPPIPGSGPTTPAMTSETRGQIGFPSVSTVSSPGPTTASATTLRRGWRFGNARVKSRFGKPKPTQRTQFYFRGSGLNTQPTGLGALNSQQPLTTGLGGFGTGFSTTNGLGPQMTDAQGAANPFKMTMFSNTARFGSGGSGGLGTNPGLGIGGGFSGGFGGLPGTPFGQIPNT